MNLFLFSFVFILFTLEFPYEMGENTYFFDVLPDFVGYLLLWFTLEKRRINKRMNLAYTAVSVMTVLSFLAFLAQIRFLVIDAPAATEFLNGDGFFINLLLDGFAAIYAGYNGIFMLLGAAILFLIFFAMLGHWEQHEQYKNQRMGCVAGFVLCSIIGLCDLGSALIILPFSWFWISYPLSVLAIATLWYTVKDCSQMETGIRN